jgi:hypothetical protein
VEDLRLDQLRQAEDELRTQLATAGRANQRRAVAFERRLRKIEKEKAAVKLHKRAAKAGGAGLPTE